MDISFERNALYEEVWAVPLVQLAKKYGLSDNGIRKVCKAMAIPLPTAGHWAKIAAGKTVPKVPLPAEAQRTTFTSHIAAPEDSFRLPEDDEWLDARVAFERQKENQIQFDPKPRRWHPAVAPLRNKILAEVKELPRFKRDAEMEEKHPAARREPNFNGWKWRSFLSNGQLLCHTHKASPLRVTPLTYERALAILNTLCFQAEARGFMVTLAEEPGRIVFEGFDGDVQLRISERLGEEWRTEQSKWETKPRNEKYKVPTGKLQLFVGEFMSELVFIDTSDRPIENKLNEIFLKIYTRIVRARERKRKNDAWHRELEEEQRKKEADEQLRRAAAAAKENERKKREALIEEVRAWQTAKLIRDYLTHLQAHPSDDARSGSRNEEWHDWARRVAEDIDPTAKRR